jgi:hypothetical protein
LNDTVSLCLSHEGDLEEGEKHIKPCLSRHST